MSAVEYRHPTLKGMDVVDTRHVDLDERQRLRRRFDAAAARTTAQRKYWLAELHDHRAIHRQSRFRWWSDDVMITVTHNTRGRLNFTELKHLAWLEKWRQDMVEYAEDCRWGMAEPLHETANVFGNNDDAWERIGAAVNMDPQPLRKLLFFHTNANFPWTPNTQVQRIHKMGFRNPLIRIWELKQLVAMYTAAVDVHEDTLIDLVEELRPTHRMSDILRAANTASEERLHTRITTARDARGGPDDPRRVPRQPDARPRR